MVTLKNILLISCLTFIQFVSAYQNYEKCIKPGDFALTFDDGPNTTTEIVLDLLKKENIKATFFVNGQNYLGEVRKSSKAQELIKREFNEGHIVASHTFSHPTVGITKFSDAELTKDLKDLNDLLYDLIQVKPAFFRPPLGEYSPANEKVIEAQGFTANINWNLDPKDWANEGKNPPETYLQTYINKLSKADPTKDSFIALNHDVYKNTVVNLIPEVIKLVRKHGFKFVTMDECLGLSPYQDSSVIPGNSTNTVPATTSVSSTSIPTPQSITQPDVKQNLQKSGYINSMAIFSISSFILICLNILNLL
ncbi:glycoside hydrolase/deacetylase [Neocallimastix lanati (nom. inval.)]|jgi:peptidoglycan/xylan/chitin deacetylase (PgdA/CDA1 family)|nr:glycoside hydrolase/deacetylase [Neocallimastix sp. JGI-2020a]